MAVCAYCGAETELYQNGIAVCLPCLKKWEDANSGNGTKQQLPPEKAKGSTDLPPVNSTKDN
jgi:hypothetical protein